MKKVSYLPIYKDDYVGIKLINGEVFFSYPYELNATIKTDKNLSHIFLSSLTEFNDYLFSNGTSNPNNFYFYSLQWIIKDYISNGIKRKRIIEFYKNSKGRINWKQTIKKSQTNLTKEGIIFSDLISEKNTELEDEISKIYQFCLAYATSVIGWIYGINYTYNLSINKRNSISILKKELMKSFKDESQIKLKHLINIIEEAEYSAANKNVTLFGLETYHQVYEFLLKKVFTNSFSSFHNININPKGVWEINKSLYESSSLRPDFVIEDDRSVFIFDAKFYRIGNYKDKISVNYLPSTSDIQKQIIYGDYIKTKTKKEVFNVFILPTKSEMFLSFLGKAYIPSINSNKHHTIVSFEIDLEKLLFMSYNKQKFDVNYLKNLIYSNSFH